MAEPDPHHDRDPDRSVEGMVTLTKGEPDRYTALHRSVFFLIGVGTATLGVLVLISPAEGPITLEAVAYIVGLLGTAVSAAVSWYGVGQGYAVAAVPGLIAAALSLGLGVWMVMVASVAFGVMFLVMGVVAAMTSVAAWMELLP